MVNQGFAVTVVEPDSVPIESGLGVFHTKAFGVGADELHEGASFKRGV